LLTQDPPASNGKPVENLLIVTAVARNEMVTLTVASKQLSRGACENAMMSVEPWTMKLLEKQLGAEIEFLEEEEGCGLRISMPMDGTHHVDKPIREAQDRHHRG
jgi:hypothetical protein